MGHPLQKLKIQLLSHFKGDLPRYESKAASGFDIRAQLSATPGGVIQIRPMERVLIPTGISLEIPEGFEVQARPRSGLAIKRGLTLLNSPGTIDADYRGEVKMIAINLGSEVIEIQDQERIAQLVLCPVVQAQFELVERLDETARGAGGFGSTGVTSNLSI